MAGRLAHATSASPTSRRRSAAVNLAGPRAREIMAAVTDLDCSAEAFKYLDAQAGAQVAGVPCLILRIGFVGEVATRSTSRPPTASTCGTRCSRPAPSTASARSAWSRSASCACRSCTSSSGRTPTRSRRRTAPPCRGSSSSTRRRTSSAAGRSSAPRSSRAETALVGFTMADGARPDRGRRGPRRRTAGRSARSPASRCSPQLGEVIGMAWVPAALAADGAAITISDERPRATRRPCRRARSTTPRGRCCAREPRVPRPSPRRGADGCGAARAQPDGARTRGAAGARFEVRDGWNVAVALRRRARRGTRRLGRRLAPRQARAARRRRRRVERRARRAGRRPAARRGGCRSRAARARDLRRREPALRARLEEAAAAGGRRDVTDGVRALAIVGPLAREIVRPLLRARPAPAGHAGPGLPPRLRRPHAGLRAPRGRGPLPAARSAPRSASTCGRSSPTPPAISAAARSASTRSCAQEAAPMRDLFRKRRMWRRAGSSRTATTS